MAAVAIATAATFPMQQRDYILPHHFSTTLSLYSAAYDDDDHHRDDVESLSSDGTAPQSNQYMSSQNAAASHRGRHRSSIGRNDVARLMGAELKSGVAVVDYSESEEEEEDFEEVAKTIAQSKSSIDILPYPNKFDDQSTRKERARRRRSTGVCSARVNFAGQIGTDDENNEATSHFLHNRNKDEKNLEEEDGNDNDDQEKEEMLRVQSPPPLTTRMAGRPPSVRRQAQRRRSFAAVCPLLNHLKQQDILAMPSGRMPRRKSTGSTRFVTVDNDITANEKKMAIKKKSKRRRFSTTFTTSSISKFLSSSHYDKKRVEEEDDTFTTFFSKEEIKQCFDSSLNNANNELDSTRHGHPNRNRSRRRSCNF